MLQPIISPSKKYLELEQEFSAQRNRCEDELKLKQRKKHELFHPLRTERIKSKINQKISRPVSKMVPKIKEVITLDGNVICV
jgi:hypothetical protein